MTQATVPDLCEHCPLNLKVELALSQHERRLNLLESDVKELSNIAAQFKLLLSLSIGGGGLSVITLIMFLIKLSIQ